MDRGSLDVETCLTLARAAVACTPPRPRRGPDPVGAAFEAVMDATPPSPERHALLADLAERRPDLVLWRATDWLDDDDVAILVRLPAHWFRVAVAGSLRPWSQRAIDEMAEALADDAGAAVLGRVMADDYPELTRPAGVTPTPDRRWHAIGGEIWEWSLWRSDDGCHALEVVVSTGLVDFTVGGVVDDELVDAWRLDGPAALDAEIDRLRRSATTR